MTWVDIHKKGLPPLDFLRVRVVMRVQEFLFIPRLLMSKFLHPIRLRNARLTFALKTCIDSGQHHEVAREHYPLFSAL